MVRRSFAVALADRLAVMAATVAAMAVLSRLLTPAEIGLFLVASTVVLLIEALRDFGIGAFLVSEPDLTLARKRTAVTLIAATSLGLGGATVLAAPLLARFYGDPALVPLVRAAALAFLMAPIGTPLLALMRREMRFGAVAAVNVSAALANAGLSIALALGGFGAMSLVLGSVAGAGVTALAAVLIRPEPAIFRPTLSEWRRVLPFGAWASIVTVLGMALDALPRLVLGRVLGFGPVGLLARAISTAQLPEKMVLSAVQPVLLPALSAEARRGTPLGPALMTGLAYVSGLQWPALAMIALLAHPIVTLLLGQQWLEVVPLVRIVAPALAMLVPVYLCYPTLVALGRVRDMALAMAVLLPASLAVLAAAAPRGTEATAWALLATGAMQAGLLLFVLRRRVRFALADLVVTALRSAALTVATLAPAALVLAALGAGLAPGPGSGAAAVAAGAAGWTAGVLVLRHPLRAELRAIVRALRRVNWAATSRASRPSG